MPLSKKVPTQQPLSGYYKAFWGSFMTITLALSVACLLLIGACLAPVFGGQETLLGHPLLAEMKGLALVAIGTFSGFILALRDLDKGEEVQFVKPDFESRQGFFNKLAAIRPEVLTTSVCFLVLWFV